MSTPDHILAIINAGHAAAHDTHRARMDARAAAEYLFREIQKLTTRVRRLEEWKKRRWGRKAKR